MPKPHYQVTAAVLWDGDRVLVARRPPGARHAGAWEFPGGKQEPGETLEECVCREIREELDIDITVEHPLIAVDHDYGPFSLTLHAYLCRPADGRKDPKGQDQWAWCPPEELDRFDLLPPDRRIATALQTFLMERGRVFEHLGKMKPFDK